MVRLSTKKRLTEVFTIDGAKKKKWLIKKGIMTETI